MTASTSHFWSPWEHLSIKELEHWVCNARYDNIKDCAILAMQCLSPACNLDATRRLTWRIDAVADTATSRLLGGFHTLLCAMYIVHCTRARPQDISHNLSLFTSTILYLPYAYFPKAYFLNPLRGLKTCTDPPQTLRIPSHPWYYHVVIPKDSPKTSKRKFSIFVTMYDNVQNHHYV